MEAGAKEQSKVAKGWGIFYACKTEILKNRAVSRLKTKCCQHQNIQKVFTFNAFHLIKWPYSLPGKNKGKQNLAVCLQCLFASLASRSTAG